MKINQANQQHTIIGQKKVTRGKSEELPREQVILGQYSDDLGMMKQLADLKSCSTGDIGSMLLKAYSTGGAIGIVASGAGLAGKAFGGLTGAAIAAGTSALVGGFVAGKYFGSEGQISIKDFAIGALAGGGLAAAGAGLGFLNNAWIAVPAATVAGGVGGFISTKEMFKSKWSSQY